MSFTARALEVVRNIPKGKTLSYAEVATLAGSPGAMRVVGSLMKKNFDPTVPCHRVIRTDGTIGDYNRGGTEAKRRLLAEEGVSL